MYASKKLYSQEEFYQEEDGDGVGQQRDFLSLAAKDLHCGIGDQADADCVTNGTGDGHTDEHQRHGHDLIHIVEIHILQSLQHQNAHIDQGSGSGCCRNDGCHLGCKKWC